MSEDFYRAFEDRYRGARAEIARRLDAYRPFLLALAARGGPAPALDLGCGRGEWLELLAACGIAGRGVDLDEGMLRACRERHLDVERADALASLRALPDASLALVSAFHLVEHLPFGLVQQIIAEARRVLRPGGLLIFETPNPENLTVGASSFYLDPSHERPLPPALLAFAVEFGGFARQRVLRLQEAPQLRGDGPVDLLAVLEGVSPDYAVVAQQDGEAALTAPFDPLFAAEHGLTLAALAQRYDARLQQRDGALHLALQRQGGELQALHAALQRHDGEAQALHAALQRHDGEAQALHAALQRHGGELQALHAALQRQGGEVQSLHAALQRQDGEVQSLHAAHAAVADDLRGQHAFNAALTARLEAEAARVATQYATQDARHAALAAQLLPLPARQDGLEQRLAQLEARGGQLEQRIVDLLSSTSWRVTAPLRWLGGAAGGARRRSAAAATRAFAAVRRRAGVALRALMRAVLRRPRLKRAAREVVARLPRLQARLYRMLQHAPAPEPSQAPPPSTQQLSPRALQAYQQLQRALRTRKH